MTCFRRSLFESEDILDQIERQHPQDQITFGKRCPAEEVELEEKDELEQRLRDLRAQIKDAKVDW